MDRIFKAVSDDVKERSPIQRELFRICYERKRNRYEEGYTSLVMNRFVFFWIISDVISPTEGRISLC